MNYEQFQETGMDFGNGFHTYYPALRDLSDHQVEIQFIPRNEVDALMSTFEFEDYEPVPEIEGAFVGRGSFLFSVVADQTVASSLPQLERALYDLLEESGQFPY
jgi:hypothetical protein